MSDINPSNTCENSFVVGECEKYSDPLRNFEFFRNNSTNQRELVKDDYSCSNSEENKEFSTFRSDVYAIMSDDQNLFKNLPASSTDESIMVENDFTLSHYNQSTKNTVNDKLENMSGINKISTKTCVPASVCKKYVGKQEVSSNCKNKNSSGFSMFGQLLNKKQNNSILSKSSGSINNISLPVNLEKNSPCHESKSEGSATSDNIQKTQMKTKLRSMWNNVKYGWRIKREVNLKTDSAIWLLGQCYHNKLNDDDAITQDVAEHLRLDLLSKIWLTYRINFPAIPGTSLVSDSGWGCMLRCGQMMMAQAFVCHFLQRDWRLSSEQYAAENQLYKTILRWFGDSLSDRSPFSLHHLVSLGEIYGRKAGDWYGPTHAAHVLRDALHKTKQNHPLLQQLCMYVASDGIVFKQDVMDLCSDLTSKDKTDCNPSLHSDFINLSNSPSHSTNGRLKNLTTEFQSICKDTSDEPKSFTTECPSYSEFGPPSYSSMKPKWNSLILFVSVRLGNDKMNPFYIPCLKSLLAYEHCIGIIGGRPKHALYFIGWQDDKIIHMDPHCCQPVVDVEKDDFNTKSFHSSCVRMISFGDMDPSCSIGFYFREQEDFLLFVEKFSEITAPLKRNLEYPIFALADGKRTEIEDDICEPNEKRIHPLSVSFPDDDDNDYILL